MIRRKCLNPFSRRPLTSLRPSRTRRRRSTEEEARPHPTKSDAASDAATEASLSPEEGTSGTNRTNGDCDLPSPPTNTGVGRRAAAIFLLPAPRGDPRGELPPSCPLRTHDARSDASHPLDSRTRRRGGPGPTSVDHARGVAHAAGALTARIPPALKPKHAVRLGVHERLRRGGPEATRDRLGIRNAATDTFLPASSFPAHDKNRRSLYHEPQQRRAPSEGPASSPAARRWGRQGAAVHVRHVQP